MKRHHHRHQTSQLHWWIVAAVLGGLFLFAGWRQCYGQQPVSQTCQLPQQVQQQPQQQAYVLVPQSPWLRSVLGWPQVYAVRPIYRLEYQPRTVYVPTWQPVTVPPQPQSQVTP
jgi:hypothetical protein